MNKTVGELKALALNNFKKRMPRNSEELAKLIQDVFQLGIDTGIEIGRKEVNHTMCNFGED